jgi:hypothetical protein
MDGLATLAEEMEVPAVGETAQVWVTPAVPVWVKVTGVETQADELTGENAAETTGTTVTETVFVTVWQGVLRTQV